MHTRKSALVWGPLCKGLHSEDRLLAACIRFTPNGRVAPLWAMKGSNGGAVRPAVVSPVKVNGDEGTSTAVELAGTHKSAWDAEGEALKPSALCQPTAGAASDLEPVSAGRILRYLGQLVVGSVWPCVALLLVNPIPLEEPSKVGDPRARLSGWSDVQVNASDGVR